ncbi:MAG: DUF4149 domain-containing protein [Candidatus Obscuribacterales bacterium]|nr:DUF4149 domain-containing protein [Candidatus Obscuribacterales bacterium]
MQTFSKIMRLISLSLLTGGSAAVTFTAIVLVKAAVAHGVSVSEAATANAPIFLSYSKVAMGAAVILAIAELIDFSSLKVKTRLDHVRYASSLLAIACVAVFTFGIVPPMESLLPDIKTVTEAREQFHHLHELSRAIFGTSMLFAFVSLLLPVFKKETSIPALSKEGKEAVSIN